MRDPRRHNRRVRSLVRGISDFLHEVSHLIEERRFRVIWTCLLVVILVLAALA